MIHHADCSLPKPWNGFGVRDLGVRVKRGHDVRAREKEKTSVREVE